MMILKLYGAAQTTFTRRIGTALYEGKVLFELIEVDFRNGQHKAPSYLAEMFRFICTRTRAICRYIEAKYPAYRLVPTDLQKHALFEQTASVELTAFDPSAIMAPGLQPGLAVVDREIVALDKTLEAYDVILAKQKYVAGDSWVERRHQELTLADLFHLPQAPLLAKAGSDFMTRRPNIARPSWLAFKDGVKRTLEY
ncbi:hypothetical protein FB451DRAFT_1364991 [Mycena latifolia]|nr:hypothetical protein FB451DRAFT_1364991 [Mycena latifolia]